MHHASVHTTSMVLLPKSTSWCINSPSLGAYNYHDCACTASQYIYIHMNLGTKPCWITTIKVLLIQQTMIYLCTKPQCINLSWFCFPRNNTWWSYAQSLNAVMIYVCTNPRCIHICWFCFRSKIMIDLCTSLGAPIYHEFASEAQTWYIYIYICAKPRCTQNNHDFDSEAKSWYIYAPTLGAYNYSDFVAKQNSW